MNVPGLHLIRTHQRTLAKWVLALFCVVWIQAALLPCAMAVVPDGMAGPGEEHCSYCPPTGAADTHGDNGTAATCTYPDQPQADARASALASIALALPPVAYVLDADPGHTVPSSDGSGPLGRAGPPIIVSYCRFLK